MGIFDFEVKSSRGGCRRLPGPPRKSNEVDTWEVVGHEKSWPSHTLWVEGYPANSHSARRFAFTFWVWRDADFISSYIGRYMKAEFEKIREADKEREKFLAMHGGTP